MKSDGCRSSEIDKFTSFDRHISGDTNTGPLPLIKTRSILQREKYQPALKNCATASWVLGVHMLDDDFVDCRVVLT